MKKNSKIKPPFARGQKEEGQTLSQDVDCLMGSYMPPCPPWTDWYNCFHFFLYVPSAKTSESNLSDKQEGSNYVFQFIFCSFTIMDIPYMLKYLGMITILWHLVTLAKRRTANITYVKFRLISLLAQNRSPIITRLPKNCASFHQSN